MFTGGGFGVGLTVTDLGLPVVRVPGERPARLSEVLPVRGRSAVEKAVELRRVQALKAQLAGYELELVAGFAADRPDALDRRPGRRGAAADADPGDGTVPGVGAREGVSEFFADELALVLNCSRTQASVLAEEAATLAETLPATRAALEDGELDWSRARVLARELGWKARATDPAIVAAVEAAVLPVAAEVSVKRLEALVRRELIARDADTAEKRRRDAQRAADVRLRPVGDGMSELVAKLPHPVAAAIRDAVDGYARAAKTGGDERPIGMLRAGALADLVLQPWGERDPVAVELTVVAPLDALTPARFLEQGAPAPAAFTRPGAVPAPTAEVAGAPITAAHLRDLLTQVDALCPGGLQAPTGGSLTFALTDPDGTLRAVLDRRELERLARRGCPTHPADEDGGSGASSCGCAVISRPAATSAYRPTAAQRRFLTTRDRTCRHPGCANRAGWADLDHVLPHARDGATCCDNLCCLCRRHHRLKTHAPGWLHAMTDDGVLTVTTPSGVARTSRPPGHHEARGRQRGRPPLGCRPRGDEPPAGWPINGPSVLSQRPTAPAATPAPDDEPPPF